MAMSELLGRYMEPLVEGKRAVCRRLVQEALSSGSEPKHIYQNLIWPAMERVDRLYRDDQINRATEHLATRINRTVADHLQAELKHKERNGKRILITCADDEPEELGAQMCADLFESDGWDVYLLGGGVPHDEVLSLVGQLRPDILLVFGSKPTDAPTVRNLIDRLREVGACPTMNIMVSGGVFQRAKGLWEEVKADVFAETAADALRLADSVQPRKPEVRIPGAPKKRRRRRRPPLLAKMEANA